MLLLKANIIKKTRIEIDGKGKLNISKLEKLAISPVLKIKSLSGYDSVEKTPTNDRIEAQKILKYLLNIFNKRPKTNIGIKKILRKPKKVVAKVSEKLE